MKRKLAVVGLTVALSLFGTVLLGSSPASASGTDGLLCTLNSNAWMYNIPLGTHVADVHAPHGFRIHGLALDSFGRQWAYGHSAENPLRDGFILIEHLTC